ncbi:rhomboid family intramembrane serine protease [Aurantivibrio infirmus]
MVIIPTEKSFDWQHAPVVLISLVLLNILVFFFYQSGDAQKFQSAFDTYDHNELFDIEWPLYESFLVGQGDEELLETYQLDMEEGYFSDIAGAMFFDEPFQSYLKEQAPDLIKKDEDYFKWKNAKAEIYKELDSVSFRRFGLFPNDLDFISPLTYQFLHGDLMHLIGNLFFLVVCGFAVEAAIGHLRFLLFYLITGVVGGLAHALISPDSSTPLVGASGSISGVMAMYLGIFRFKKIEFFYWFFIFVGYFRAPALLILPIYVGKELFSYFSDTESNVAFMAHAGGFISGSILMAATFIFAPKKINEEYVESDQSAVDPMLGKLAKVYDAIGNYQFESAQKQVQLLIEEFGSKFELIVLKYNLSKIDKPKEYKNLVMEILSARGNSAEQKFQMEKVWKENPELQNGMNDDIAVQLGMNFSNEHHFNTAEEIFKILHERGSQHPNLGLFARKLAQAASSLKLDAQKRNYSQFADSLKAL